MDLLGRLLGKFRKDELPIRRRGRAREAGPQPARRVRRQRELRHGEQLAADVLQRQVHLALRVGKDTVSEHASGQALGLGLVIAALHAHEREDAPADGRDLGAVDLDRGV